MATLQDLADKARHHLRDFPRHFEQTTANTGRTYKLAHPNVIASSLYVATQVGANAPVELVAGTNYNLDARNGLIRLTAAPTANSTLLIEGYYYEWLMDEDLLFAAGIAENLITSNLDSTLENLSPVVVDVTAIATVVEALWGLAAEFSRDIDVSTPESVHVPASDRFRMLMPLLDRWMSEYDSRARALNIGLERIEVFTMRRTSYTFNRLVPIYKSREIGDEGPSTRLFPEIDKGVIDVETPAEPGRVDALMDIDPPVGTTTTFYQ